jgi:hypothetical protein
LAPTNSSGKETCLCVQGKQEHEIMLDECMDMLRQVAGTTARCATLSLQAIAVASSLDRFQHTTMKATVQAIHSEGQAALHKAIAVQARATGDVAAADAKDTEAAVAAHDATLAREAAYAATWQAGAWREHLRSATTSLGTAAKLCKRQFRTHEQMMSALGVAVVSATLRNRANDIADRVTVAAAQAAEAKRQADLACAAVDEMRQRAAALWQRGNGERALLAERQCASLESNAVAAAATADACAAAAAQLRTDSGAVDAQAAQAEAQTECTLEARIQMQQLVGVLQTLRDHQDAAAAAENKRSAAAVMAQEKAAMADDAMTKAAQLACNAEGLRSDGRIEEAADMVAMAATWRARGDDACNLACEEGRVVEECGMAVTEAQEAARAVEGDVTGMQVR